MQWFDDKFTKHYESLQYHHDHMRAASTNLVEVIGWKKNNKEKPHGLPILDKLQDKKTDVSIETWEGICDSVETLINGGKIACE